MGRGKVTHCCSLFSADAGRDGLSLQRFVAAAATHDFELRLPEHRGSSAANPAGGAFRRPEEETAPSILGALI